MGADNLVFVLDKEREVPVSRPGRRMNVHPPAGLHGSILSGYRVGIFGPGGTNDDGSIQTQPWVFQHIAPVPNQGHGFPNLGVGVKSVGSRLAGGYCLDGIGASRDAHGLGRVVGQHVGMEGDRAAGGLVAEADPDAIANVDV